jgi:glycosyltransferase involved in cell wall biosynthesis
VIPDPSRDPAALVDVLVSTFNSERYLDECLASARRCLPVGRILVADHASTDRTQAIARAYGAEIFEETRGLGFSRSLLLREARSPYVVFLDSDVIMRRSDFWRLAQASLGRPRVGAVVGMAMGHRFLYGLPFSLTVLPRRWATAVQIPDDVQARETYYFQQALARDRLRTDYILDAMEHHSQYRGHKPEWEGASTRRVAGLSPRQLAYAFIVVLLIHMNSRAPRNVLYTPFFYAKFMRGFLNPARWGYLDRRVEPP